MGEGEARYDREERNSVVGRGGGGATFGGMDECTNTGLVPNVMQMETKNFS